MSAIGSVRLAEICPARKWVAFRSLETKKQKNNIKIRASGRINGNVFILSVKIIKYTLFYKNTNQKELFLMVN